jgi:hypothetical protein
MIQRTQRPLLNLAADRFQVRCLAEGCGSFGLPATWTAQVVLVDPGDADGPAVGSEQRGHRTHERRLAGAVRPEQADDLASAHAERHARERLRRT